MPLLMPLMTSLLTPLLAPLPTPGRLWSLPVLFGVLSLASCGPARNQFAPTCPAPRLVPALADFTHYAGKGPAHDLTDMIVQARIVSIKGNCQNGDDPNTVLATVNIGVSVQRGPAMKGRDADMPIFLAVTQGDDVRDKRIFQVHVAFPPNVDRVTLNSPDITLNLPVNGKITGASYGIIAGFQLTPDELAGNRQAQGR